MADTFTYGKEHFAKDLEDCGDSPEEKAKTKIFSLEGLSGGMFTGARAKTYADRIYQSFGTTKILIVVREPMSLAYSIWNQYIREGGLLSLERFFTDPYSPAFENGGTIWRKLVYRDLISYWIDLMGEERVRVLLLEDLVKSKEHFYSSMFNFLGVSSYVPQEDRIIKRSYSRHGTDVKRRLNLLYRTPHNPNGILSSRAHERLRSKIIPGLDHYLSLRGDKKGAKETIASLISEPLVLEIKKSNQWIGDRTGRDVGGYGYIL